MKDDKYTREQQTLKEFFSAVLAYTDAGDDLRRTHADLMAADERWINAQLKLTDARMALHAEIVKEVDKNPAEDEVK